MIQSLGLDVIATERISAAVDRFGQRFSRRILGPDELLLLQQRKDTVQFLAGRFAAKEAVIKALADMLDTRPSFQSIQILNDPGGKPTPSFGEALREKLSGYTCLISISHDKNVAAAVAIISEKS